MKRKTILISILLIIIFVQGCGKNEVSLSPISEEQIILEPIIEKEPVSDLQNSPRMSEKDEKVFIEKSSLPLEDFMERLEFPDWDEDINNSLLMNNMYGFKGYKDQGKLYITVPAGVESFEVFINDIRLDAASLSEPGTYAVDFSNISVNGINTIIVNNVLPTTLENKIAVNIEYPIVIEGNIEDSGIDSRVFEFIERIADEDIKNGFTSAQMAVIKDGKLIYENAWGKTNSYTASLQRTEEYPDVTVDTLYDLASNTKMYTVNYAIQYLVSIGQMSINDKVTDYLGDDFYEKTIDITYRGYENPGLETNKEWKKNLTIKDILAHQAGFPADPKYEVDKVDQSRQALSSRVENVLFSGNDGSAETKEKTLEAICKTPLMYEPGSKTLYSDADYMLLGFIIEEITGKSLDEFMDDFFYRPLELEHITFNPLKNGFAKEDCAATELQGNTREGKVNFTNIRTDTVWGEVHDEKAYYAMGGVSGHAGLFSNASDLARLASIMLTGGYGGHMFFRNDVIDVFTAPKSTEYPEWGLGWWRNGDNNRPWYFSDETTREGFGHQGWTGTLTVIDPEQNLVVVYLTNRVNSPLIKSGGTSKFAGTVYTAGSLGYATQLIYRGINANPEKLEDELTSILADMAIESIKLIPDTEKKSSSPHVKNAYSKIKLLKERTEKYPETDKGYLDKCLPLLDETRDAEFIELMK